MAGSYRYRIRQLRWYRETETDGVTPWARCSEQELAKETEMKRYDDGQNRPRDLNYAADASDITIGTHSPQLD